MVEELLIQISGALMAQKGLGMLNTISALVEEKLNEFTKERLAKSDKHTDKTLSTKDSRNLVFVDKQDTNQRQNVGE